jgi:pimeloyl-ACP methyl ester carboxylesterase
MGILKATVREVSAAVRCGVRMTLRGRDGSRKRGLNPTHLSQHQTSKSPTIFLHGDFHNATAFYSLSEHLRDQGVGPLYTIEYSGLDDGLDQLDALIAQIRTHYARWGVHDITVNLVGHSMGGIVAAEFLRRSPDKVQRVITVGSRLKPTGALTFAYRSSRAAIAHLHAWLDQHRSRLPLYNIAAGRDWLVPRDAALAGCPTRHTLVRGVSHLSLLYAKETATRLTHLLS